MTINTNTTLIEYINRINAVRDDMCVVNAIVEEASYDESLSTTEYSALSEYAVHPYRIGADMADMVTDIYRLHIDSRSGGDAYHEDFEFLSEARDYAEGEWYHMVRSERLDADMWIERREAYVTHYDDIVCVDEEAEGEHIESLYCTEGDLMEWGDHLSWCEPYEVTTQDGETVRLCIGPDLVIEGDWDASDLAHAVLGDEYAEYKGYTDEELIRQIADIEIIDGGCRACPFFSVCDAMAEQRQ